MKKTFHRSLVLTFMLLIVFALSACADEEQETFNINNISISQIEVLDGETLIYNSDYNISSENSIVFDLSVSSIGSFDLVKEVDSEDTCDDNDKVFTITSNYGELNIKTMCTADDSSKDVMTVIYLDEEIVGYTSSDLFTELEEAIS